MSTEPPSNPSPRPLSPDIAAAATAWEGLIRFHRRATAAMDDTLRDRFGHSLDDYDVLHQIHRHQRRHDGMPLRMGDLAGRLLIANSSCHRIVARLVDAGLVERRKDDADGRVVFVRLTRDGKRLHRRMAVVHGRDIRTLVADPLDPDDVDQLARLLQRLGNREVMPA